MHKMEKRKIAGKTVVQSGVLAGLALFLFLAAVSQKKNIGQGYEQIYFNGELVGNVAKTVDASHAVHAVRRELAAESDVPVCMDYEYSSSSANNWFATLMTEKELKESLKERMKVSEIHTQIRAYTVAIDGYRGNFKSVQEVVDFLNAVKEKEEPNPSFTTRILKEESHIGGIMRAQLAAVGGEADGEEVKLAEQELQIAQAVSAGVNGDLASQMTEDSSDSKKGYEMGTLDMKFLENVEVYENYVSAEELCDVDGQVEEVTKEKETNKIYVVENGDVLSVIAMNHDTTVANILTLNGFDSADVRIFPGQELIIAVPEPDLSLKVTKGEVYEEDYQADPVIIENDEWYTTEQVVHQEGTAGHRERNDIVTYENGVETARELAHETILVESTPAVIEQGTIKPPTYIKPLAGGHFTSGFGRRWGRMHKGVDWGCPTGTTVYASSAGTVVSAGYNSGYGNNVVISHPDGRMTRYAHNSKLLVHAGQWVEQGQSIALSGSTGRSTGPHVHFEIYINGVAVNPLDYIGQ